MIEASGLEVSETGAIHQDSLRCVDEYGFVTHRYGPLGLHKKISTVSRACMDVGVSEQCVAAPPCGFRLGRCECRALGFRVPGPRSGIVYFET